MGSSSDSELLHCHFQRRLLLSSVPAPPFAAAWPSARRACSGTAGRDAGASPSVGRLVVAARTSSAVTSEDLLLRRLCHQLGQFVEPFRVPPLASCMGFERMPVELVELAAVGAKQLKKKLEQPLHPSFFGKPT